MRAFVALSTLLAVAAPLSAQQAAPPDGWTFGVGGIVILWPNVDFNSGGPALQVSRVTPGGIGFDARVAYLMPSGPSDQQGASVLLGLSYGVALGSHLLQLKGGATAYGLVDSDAAGGDAGPYLGGGVLIRLSRKVGLNLDALARFYTVEEGSDMAPTVGFAIVVLP